MSFNKEDAVRIERHPKKSGGPRLVYVFNCTAKGCTNQVRIRSCDVSTAKGKCGSCSHRKRPFESIFNYIGKDHREYVSSTLTYEEFLEFTEIDSCHYCGDSIPWEPYGTVNGKFRSRAYYLDRKDSSGDYTKENCVVACTPCNKLKGNRFSYEEFLLLSPALITIRINRGGQPLAPVPYEEALKHQGAEFVEESADICKISGRGGSCGE